MVIVVKYWLNVWWYVMFCHHFYYLMLDCRVLLVPFRVSVPASQQLSHAAYLLLFEPYLTHLIRWKWWYMMVATARLRSILVGMSEMLIDCVFTGWCFQDIHFPCFIQQCRCVTEQWQSSVLVWQPQRRVVELFSCHAVPHAVCKKMPQGDAQCWEILVFFRPIDRMTGWMSLKSLKALPELKAYEWTVRQALGDGIWGIQCDLHLWWTPEETHLGSGWISLDSLKRKLYVYSILFQLHRNGRSQNLLYSNLRNWKTQRYPKIGGSHMKERTKITRAPVEHPTITAWDERWLGEAKRKHI